MRYELPAVAQTLTFTDMVAILETLQGVLWTYEDSEIDPDKDWNSETLNDIGNAMDRLKPRRSSDLVFQSVGAYIIEHHVKDDLTLCNQRTYSGLAPDASEEVWFSDHEIDAAHVIVCTICEGNV